jgi:hypothetical protein
METETSAGVLTSISDKTPNLLHLRVYEIFLVENGYIDLEYRSWDVEVSAGAYSRFEKKLLSYWRKQNGLLSADCRLVVGDVVSTSIGDDIPRTVADLCEKRIEKMPSALGWK